MIEISTLENEWKTEISFLVAWSKCGSKAAVGTDDGEIVLLNVLDL